MKTTRREFIHASAAVTLSAAQPMRGAPVVTPESKNLDAFQIARRHSIVSDLPSPNFGPFIDLARALCTTTIIARV
jgi:hypothetical protein